MHRESRLLFVPFVAIIWVGSMSGCERPQAPAAPPPPDVTVSRPLQREVIEWDEYTGRLDAVEMVDVRARVSGFIESAPYVEGAVVKKGDLLFVIDVRPFQAELDKAKADLQVAEAKRSFADVDYKRLLSLGPDEAASPLELEKAKQTLMEGEGEVMAAKAEIQSAQLNVEWCQVTAPISGRVSNKIVTAGNLITGGQAQATLLTTIISRDPIYCYIDVDEHSVLKYQELAREKKRVSARDARIPTFMGLANETGFPHEGVVDFVDNRVDPTTGTLRGRGVFPNPDGYLTPGFFARVRIPGSGRYEAILIPDAAIGTNQDQKFVLVVDDKDMTQPRPVKLGALFGTLRAIETGVGPNDRVVINGVMRVRPGMKVAPELKQIGPSDFELTAPGSPTTRELPATRHLPEIEKTTRPAAMQSSTTRPTTREGYDFTPPSQGEAAPR